MTENELARAFYENGIVFADEHKAPRAAIAKAQFRSAIQIFSEEEGPAAIADWLEREAKQFRDALDNAWAFDTGGTA